MTSDSSTSTKGRKATTPARRNYGSGGLTQRKAGVWRAVTRRAGKQVTTTLYADDRPEAERLFQAWLAGLPQEPVKGTVEDLFNRWLDYSASRLEATTMRNYRTISREVCAVLGAVKLRDLKSSHFQTYYDGLATPQKVAHHHAVIRRACNLGVRWEMLAFNPVNDSRTERPAVHKVRPVMPTDDVASDLILRAFASDEVRGALIWLAISTGARRGELVGLRWSNVDLVAGTVHYAETVVDVGGKLMEKDTKTHQARTVPLSQDSVDMLRTHLANREAIAKAHGTQLQPTAFVFSDTPRGGQGLRPDALTKWWTGLRDSTPGAGHVRLHDLRHLMATRWVAMGIAMVVVAEALGHADPSTTVKYYAHAEQGAQRQAAELAASRMPVMPLALPAVAA